MFFFVSTTVSVTQTSYLYLNHKLSCFSSLVPPSHCREEEQVDGVVWLLVKANPAQIVKNSRGKEETKGITSGIEL